MISSRPSTSSKHNNVNDENASSSSSFSHFSSLSKSLNTPSRLKSKQKSFKDPADLLPSTSAASYAAPARTPKSKLQIGTATTGTTGRRRALGDISNRKQRLAGAGDDGGGSSSVVIVKPGKAASLTTNTNTNTTNNKQKKKHGRKQVSFLEAPPPPVLLHGRTGGGGGSKKKKKPHHKTPLKQRLSLSGSGSLLSIDRHRQVGSSGGGGRLRTTRPSSSGIESSTGEKKSSSLDTKQQLSSSAADPLEDDDGDDVSDVELPAGRLYMQDAHGGYEVGDGPVCSFDFDEIFDKDNTDDALICDYQRMEEKRIEGEEEELNDRMDKLARDDLRDLDFLIGGSRSRHRHSRGLLFDHDDVSTGAIASHGDDSTGEDLFMDMDLSSPLQQLGAGDGIAERAVEFDDGISL